MLFMHAPTAIVPSAGHRARRRAAARRAAASRCWPAGWAATWCAPRAEACATPACRPTTRPSAPSRAFMQMVQYRAQPRGAAADAASPPRRLRHATAARRGADRAARAGRRPRDARRARGQGAAGRLRHPGGRDRSAADARGRGRRGAPDRLPGGAEDPVAADHPQVRRRRRRARPGRRAGGAGGGRARWPQRVRALRPDAQLAGFTVQAMVQPAAGARADRRRRHRPGVRAGAAVRPGRHGRRGAARPRGGPAAAQHACWRAT